MRRPFCLLFFKKVLTKGYYCIILIVLVVLIQLKQERRGRMFTLDLSSRTPIYEQLYNNVVRLISVGVLAPNDKLPPVRSLATELSVNPNTVSKAYKMLENDGYICSTVGKGSFISSDLSIKNTEKEAALKSLEAELKKCVSLGVTKVELEELMRRI